MDDAAADAAAGEGARENMAPVVAAPSTVVAGRPTEFPGPHHKRAVEQAPFRKVFQKRGIRRVHDRHQVVFQPFGVLVVGVPRRAVGGVARHPGPVHLHERNARLDEAAGQQHALAPPVPSVTVAQAFRFLLEVEGPAGGARLHQLERGLLLLLEKPRSFSQPFQLTLRRVQPPRQGDPIRQPWRRHLRRQGHPRNGETSLMGRARKQPGITGPAHETGILAGPWNAAGVPDVLGQHHGSRHSGAMTAKPPVDRRQAGPIVGRARLGIFRVKRLVGHARQHPVARRRMGVVMGGKGAQHRDPVGQPGRAGHQFPHGQPRGGGGDRLVWPPDFLGGKRLGIPGFVLGRAAQVKQVNDRTRLAASGGPGGVCGGQGRQGAPTHELTPADAVA